MPVGELIPAVDVSPADTLLAWFQGPGHGVHVRVPLVVVLSPLALSSAYVAASRNAPESESLHLTLDDGALGISLADRVRADCPNDVPCLIWVEGAFGATVAAHEAAIQDTAHPEQTFSVRAYLGLAKEPAPAVLRKAH